MTTSTLQHNDNKAVEVENRVIKKLFRRLITFLFVLFVFSFLDRINIGFAGLTMGKDLGLTSTMFGLAATLFYVTYVLCGIRTYLDEAKLLSYGKKVAVMRQQPGDISECYNALPGAAKTHKCAGDQMITL